MRRGEIFNLKWRDVDLRRRTLFLRHTKNGESRHLPISDELEKVLLSLPSRFEGGYVFPSYRPRFNEDLKSGEVNEPFTDVKNSFQKALKKAGIEDFRLTSGHERCGFKRGPRATRSQKPSDDIALCSSFGDTQA